MRDEAQIRLDVITQSLKEITKEFQQEIETLDPSASMQLWALNGKLMGIVNFLEEN